MTPEAEDYLAALTGVLRARLGNGLVGGYLHGSAVLGGWHPERSDVDVLAVCAEPSCAGIVLDLSRNRSRRFCSTACGNRAAVAAYRARQRG